MPKATRLEQFAIAKGQAFKGKFPKQYKDVSELYCEDKYDGLRGIIIRRNGKATAYTSTGVLVPNAAHICKAFEAIPGVFADRVYDGEWFCKDWNLSQGIVKTQTPHPKASQLLFKMFDTVSLVEWDKKKGLATLRARKRIAEAVVKHIQSYSQSVLLAEHTIIPCTTKAAEKHLLKSVEEGHEGCMLKDPTAVYVFKRSANWLKLKPYWEDDMTIVDAELGTEELKNANVLGALHVTGKIGGKSIRTKVGTGFTDADRKQLWKMHQQGKLVGMRIMMKHEGVTVERAVRFPGFLRLRTDD